MRAISVGVGPNVAPGTASNMVRLDEWAPAELAVQVSIAGTTTFTVQHSFDDPNDLINPVPVGSMFWDTGLIPPVGIAGTTGTTFPMDAAPLWMRIVINAGTGSAKMVMTQYDVAET